MSYYVRHSVHDDRTVFHLVFYCEVRERFTPKCGGEETVFRRVPLPFKH